MNSNFWLVVGFLAQGLFSLRFLVQWIASERRRESTIPVAFWYFSIAGGLLLLAYAISRRDAVFIVGQSLGLLVYLRNLALLRRRPRAEEAERAPQLLPWIALAAFALVMAFAFSGSRGLWEPDEGRYAECAREMLTTGDFLTPRLAWHPHFTKPPAAYWMIAASLGTLGPSEWAVRAPTALAFALTVLAVAALARRMWDPITGLLAGVVYATFLTPFIAANFVTTDTPLALWETLALLAGWMVLTSAGTASKRLWRIATGVFLGLGFMTKGPAGLLPLAGLLLFRLLSLGSRSKEPVLGRAGLMAFAVVGMPWYLAVTAKHEGLLGYLVGTEVIGRIAGVHHRNHQWYGAIAIYVPTLTIGALPWCVTWPALWRRFRQGTRPEPAWRALVGRPRVLFLALATLVPLAVFFVVRSRLPLYLLPLFAPLAIATARGLVVLGGEVRPVGLRRTLDPRGLAGAAAVWALLLIAGRFVLAVWPSPLDARRVFRSLPSHPPAEVILPEGDSPPYGLAFYAAKSAEFVEWAPKGFDPTLGPSLHEEIVEESVEASHPEGSAHVYVVDRGDAPKLKHLLLDGGATILKEENLGAAVAVLTPGHRVPRAEHASVP